MRQKYRTLFSNTAIYGTVELITTLSQLVYPALSLSIQDSAFRFAMDKTKKSEQVLKNSFFVTCIGGIVFFPFSIIMNNYYGIAGYWNYFYLFSTLSMIRSMLSLYMKGIKKTVVFAIDVVVFNGSLAIGNIVFLAFFRSGIDGYFFAAIIASFISIIFLLTNSSFLRMCNEKINRDLLKEMITYSAPLILNSISWGLTHVVDRVMLTNMIGSDANGVYSAASKIPSLMSIATTVFTQAWTISLIQDYETEKDRRFYNTVFILTHVTCILSAFGILIFNNNLFVWILGGSFSEASRYVPVLLFGTLFLTYSNFFGSFFSAAKLSKYNMYTSLAGCAFNVVFNFLLIPRIGVMGACVATAGSYVLISVLRIILSQRVYSIDLDPRRFAFSLVLLAPCAACVCLKRFDVTVSLICMVVCLLVYRDLLCSVISARKRKLQLKTDRNHQEKSDILRDNMDKNGEESNAGNK